MGLSQFGKQKGALECSKLKDLDPSMTNGFGRALDVLRISFIPFANVSVHMFLFSMRRLLRQPFLDLKNVRMVIRKGTNTSKEMGCF